MWDITLTKQKEEEEESVRLFSCSYDSYVLKTQLSNNPSLFCLFNQIVYEEKNNKRMDVEENDSSKKVNKS